MESDKLLEQLFLIFLKNKVAYVPYHNLKDYLVSRGGADFFQNSSNLSRKNSLGVGTDVRV